MYSLMHSAMQNDTVSQSSEIMGYEDQIPQTNVFHILKRSDGISIKSNFKETRILRICPQGISGGLWKVLFKSLLNRKEIRNAGLYLFGKTSKNGENKHILTSFMRPKSPIRPRERESNIPLTSKHP